MRFVSSIAKPAGHPVGVRVRVGGAPREVALRGAELPRVDLAGDVERSRAVGGAHEHVVGEREPEEQRLELMVARRLAGEDAQAEVDLGLRGDACRARARPRVCGHEPGAAGADVLPSTAGSVAARCAPLISPIESPARRKYHAPMSVMGM